MQPLRAGDNTLVRAINLTTIIKYIHAGGPVSRARLAELTGLNRSTISSLVDDLAGCGLVRAVNPKQNPAGSRAIFLEINPQAGAIVGVELGVDFLLVLLTDFTGRVLWRAQEKIDFSRDQRGIIAQSMNLIQLAIEYGQAQGLRLLGIGLTLPGIVEIERGLLTFSPNLQWRNVPLRDIIHHQTKLPVFIENDANAAALGENLFGVAQQARHFIFIVAGRGLGGGLFLNGELYRGAGGFSGEIGHMGLIAEQKRPCRCGQRGCWENAVNEYALAERVHLRLEAGRPSLLAQPRSGPHKPLDFQKILAAAAAGDQVAREAFQETGLALGQGIANLVNVFNPELVVLGGTLSTAGPYLLPAVQTGLERRAMSEPYRQTTLKLSAFGPDASVMGAIALVVQAIFSNPLRVERLARVA